MDDRSNVFSWQSSSLPPTHRRHNHCQIQHPLHCLIRYTFRVLRQAFREFIPKTPKWVDQLRILHIFLCTADRTSTSVIADLLFTSDYTDVAEKLLSHLHAVLYTEDGRVLAYHKSFSDFLFDQARSDVFWCNHATHH